MLDLVPRRGEIEPWELLGVAADATDDEVRAAFRARSRTAHPDAGGTDGMYRALTNARDAMLAKASLAGTRDAPPPPPPPPPPPTPPADWVVTDDPPHRSQPTYRPVSRNPGAAPGGASRPGHRLVGILATIPSPRTVGGWIVFLAIWALVDATITRPGTGLGHGLLSVFIGWLPALLGAAALARFRLRRSRTR